MEVIDISTLSGRKVKFGAKMRLGDEDTDDKITQIVGKANIKPRKFSITASLARDDR